MSTTQLEWIGLGSMGIGMATNLQKHLIKTSAPGLKYANRTLSRGDSIKAIGAIPRETVVEIARDCDIDFSCVSNDDILQSTADQIIASGPLNGKIYVDCSTVHPDTSLSVSEKITAAGGQFIAAPVFGASPMAEAGKLIFVTAGPDSAIQKISPYLTNVTGRSVILMGIDVSKSSLMKIAGNICVISFMEVISEAQVFAEKTGLGCLQLEAMISNIFGPVLESYSKRLTTGPYAAAGTEKAGFDVQLAMKDARHALSCAKKVGMKLEVSEVALKHMTKAVELQPKRPLDSSSMHGTIREESGLNFLSDLCEDRDGNET